MYTLVDYSLKRNILRSVLSSVRESKAFPESRNFIEAASSSVMWLFNIFHFTLRSFWYCDSNRTRAVRLSKYAREKNSFGSSCWIILSSLGLVNTSLMPKVFMASVTIWNRDRGFYGRRQPTTCAPGSEIQELCKSFPFPPRGVVASVARSARLEFDDVYVTACSRALFLLFSLWLSLALSPSVI